MSKRQWLLLLAGYLLFLLLGALVFQALERPLDHRKKYNEAEQMKDLQLMMLENLANFTDGDVHRRNILDLLLFAHETGNSALIPDGYTITNRTTSTELMDIYYNVSKEEIVIEDNWDLWNSFFFTFITVTTIGYGHLSPRTTAGQQFCVFYSLFGIPLNTLVFVNLAGFYSDYVLTEEDRRGVKNRSTLALLARAIIYLIPGVLLFLILPAVVVMFAEEWSFGQSFYFAFISLTTIGFGDYVAGHPANHPNMVIDVFYKAYIMLWTMFGLSYIIMVITFLIDAYKSQKVRRSMKKTSKILTKQAHLQVLVNRFVQIHEAQHHKHRNVTPVSIVQRNEITETSSASCMDGRTNLAFCPTDENINSIIADPSPLNSMASDQEHGVLSEPTVDAKSSVKRKLSLADIVEKIVPSDRSVSSERVGSRSQSRRPSTVLDVRGDPCNELKALADIVAAVEDLVESVENVDEGDEPELSIIEHEKQLSTQK